MDSLTYNGVEMAIICVKHIGRRHLYSDDGSTYHSTEWIFDVRTYLNPTVISYTASGVKQNGQMPAVTDRVVRALLTQPRAPLIFKQNGVVVLQTPRTADSVTDAENGPIVESFDLKTDWGGKTWMVDIRLRARVRECPRNPGPILLSNRWSKTMDTDSDYLSSITTVGQCQFDNSRLWETETWADQYRIDLMQPIPAFTKRSNISVTAHPDGFTYTYSFTDQETHFNIANAPRIECYQTEAYSQTSDGAAATQAFLDNPLNPIASVWNASVAGLPKLYSQMLVRVWGTRAQSKNVLLNMALGMAFERIRKLASVEFVVGMDRAEKMVEVQLTSRVGPEIIFAGFNEGFFAGIATTFPALTSFLDNILPGQGAAQILKTQMAGGMAKALTNISGPEASPGGFYVQQENIPNMPPPNSGGTRGTLVQRLITSLLSSPCETPPQVSQATLIGPGGATGPGPAENVDQRIYK